MNCIDVCNLQSAIGFNVRAIEQGIGCSGVYDIDYRRRMEDRATVRRAIAWIIAARMHNLIDDNQIMTSMRYVSDIVDKQNSGLPHYVRMNGSIETSLGLRATCDMIFSPEKLMPTGTIDNILINTRREVLGLDPISL